MWPTRSWVTYLHPKPYRPTWEPLNPYHGGGHGSHTCTLNPTGSPKPQSWGGAWVTYLHPKPYRPTREPRNPKHYLLGCRVVACGALVGLASCPSLPRSKGVVDRGARGRWIEEQRGRKLTACTYGRGNMRGVAWGARVALQ